MGPAQVALLALGCALLVGCGEHSRSPLRTSTLVTGLALDGKRLAWTDCTRIHVLESKRELTLRVPQAASSACRDPLENGEPEGRLVLAGANIGWFFATNAHLTSKFALGASSLKSQSSQLLRSEPDSTTARDLGLAGAVVGDRGAVLWTWPRVSILGSAARDCDLLSGRPGCGIAVADGRVSSWSTGRAGIGRRLPRAAPLAASEGLLALGAIRTGHFPQSPKSTGASAELVAPRSIVVIRSKDGVLVARIPNRLPVDALALSHRLLAVERGDRVALYRLPGGQRLRSVRMGNRLTFRFTGWIAVAGDSLILWDPGSVKAIDAMSGRSTVLVRMDASKGPITAVATDGKRVAWAATTGRGSVIRIRLLRARSR